MQDNDPQVNVPNELLEGMKIESVFITPLQKKIGVLALSGKEHGVFVLRLYNLLLDVDGMYQVTHELTAFSFYTRKELNDFIDRLPQMTAFEILMLMNLMSTIA